MNTKRFGFISVIVLVFLASFFSVSTALAAPKKTVFVVSASVGDTYSAALKVVKEMEFEVKTSDREAGVIEAQHKSTFGEPNMFLDIEVTKAGDKAEVIVDVKKRRFAVGGGKPEERLEQFRTLFSEKLGNGVTVTVKDK